MSPLARLTATETKLFFREPVGVFFVLVFPPLLLVILGLVPSFREPSPDMGGLRPIAVYVPIAIAMSIALLALTGIPQAIATYREKGILRRMRTTPVGPARLLAAQLLMAVAMAVATMVVLQLIGRLAFGVALPGQAAGYLVAYVLAAVSTLTLGVLVAALAPSGKAAGAIGTVLFFPLIFFAGVYAPREVMPDLLNRIGDFTPLGAGVQSLQDAAAGHWPQLLHVAVMAGWVVVAGGLAARYFRWE